MTKKKINYWLGHRVAFSREFLRSTGQYTDWAPFARGEVVALDEISRGFVLATIRWDDAPMGTVNVADLVREDRIHLEAV
jgi:hypothetical protein